MAPKFGFNVKKYYESDQIKKKDVQEVLEYLKSKNYPQVEEMVCISLIFCNGNVKNTKILMEGHYDIKIGIPEISTNRSLKHEKLRKTWKVIKLLNTPQLDDGTVVIILGLHDPTSSNYHIDVVFKLFFMAMMAAVYDKPITGYRVILDVKLFSLMHLTRMQPTLMMKLMKYESDGMQYCVKVMHVVNGGSIVTHAYNFITKISKPAASTLFLCHEQNMDWNEFYKNHIPKEYLPSDYGGDLESSEVLQEQLWNKLESMTDFFREEERLQAKFSGPKS